MNFGGFFYDLREWTDKKDYSYRCYIRLEAFLVDAIYNGFTGCQPTIYFPDILTSDSETMFTMITENPNLNLNGDKICVT